jgi:hypothetical protein
LEHNCNIRSSKSLAEGTWAALPVIPEFMAILYAVHTVNRLTLVLSSDINITRFLWFFPFSMPSTFAYTPRQPVMALPADSQDTSKPKCVSLCYIMPSSSIRCRRSLPNDLTKFITKHHDKPDYIVDSGGYASIYRCIYTPREGQKVEVCSISFITSYRYMTLFRWQSRRFANDLILKMKYEHMYLFFIPMSLNHQRICGER